MVCGGFSCSKNALAALNVLYILVACILIGMAAYGKSVSLIATIEMMGGIIACGVFLLLIAIVGLIGAVHHHQVLLFFYMIVLFLLFLVQFAMACALLALNTAQRENIAYWGWNHSSTEIQNRTQKLLTCCGFDLTQPEGEVMEFPSCFYFPQCADNNATCCTNTTAIVTGNLTGTCPLDDCWSKIGDHMNEAVKTVGGISLFFSFTEIIGVVLALKYRNLKDPRANPSAFL